MTETPTTTKTERKDPGPNPPHVTLCINELDQGGAEKALVRIALALSERDWRVNVVSLRDAGAMAEPLKSARIDVQPLGCGTLEDVRCIWRLRRVLCEQRPDILLCFLHQANIVGRLAGWMAKIPVVVSGVRVADRRRWVVWTDWITQGLASHCVAVSRAVGEFHAQACGISPDRWTAIPNGVDTADSPPARRGLQSPFRILFVGRLTPQKRPLDLLHAVHQLSTLESPPVRLDFVGTGELREQLETEIHRLQLSDVHLHGQQPDASKWMAQADVLVLPSAWEGLPNVVLEAMSVGLPVVATDVDGVPELIEHGVTGWLVSAGDVPGLAEQIHEIMKARELRNTVAESAFRRVRDQFSWESVANQYEELLKHLLRSAGRSEHTSADASG